MVAKRGVLAVLLAVTGMWVTVSTAHAAADTLVVKAKNGKLGPGAATSWKAKGDTVRFELAKGVDGAKVAKLLQDRLFKAKVSFAKGVLTVSGIPATSLLDQLSTLSLSGGGDPLADVAGLGNAVVAMQRPEGGGSIRAGKAAGVPYTLQDSSPKARWLGRVLSVKRGAFPNVQLELRVLRPARAGTLSLHHGQVVKAAVLYTTTTTGIDLNEAANQRNLAAYYLDAGDKITVHAVRTDSGRLGIDFVERH